MYAEVLFFCANEKWPAHCAPAGGYARKVIMHRIRRKDHLRDLTKMIGLLPFSIGPRQYRVYALQDLRALHRLQQLRNPPPVFRRARRAVRFLFSFHGLPPYRLLAGPAVPLLYAGAQGPVN